MRTRNYTPEMKERAVRMLIEAKDDYPSTWSAIKAIAPKIGCTPETLRSWHEKHLDKTIPANIQAQYCSHQYRQIIDKYGFAGSMSRKGNCYDNAPIESFWGQLKNELIYHKVYETRDEAIKDVVRYIEIFYNRQRIQKGLGFKSPTQVFQDFYRQAA